MQCSILKLLTLSVFIYACQKPITTNEKEIPPLALHIGEKSNTLGIHLFSNIAKAENYQNIIVGNYSIYQILSLLLLGTQSNSYETLSMLLKMDNHIDFHLSNKFINDIIENGLPAESQANANMLWYNKNSFPLKKTYKADSKNYYNDATTVLDFSQNLKMQQAIEDFVHKNTFEQLHSHYSSINDNPAHIYLTSGNALNLFLKDWGKGVWHDSFFYKSEHDSIPCNFIGKIYAANTIKYSANKITDIYNIPLIQDTLSLHIYMPKVPLAEYINNLHYINTLSIAENILAENMLVKIPAIQAKNSFDILPFLIEKVNDKKTFNALNLNAMTLINNGIYSIKNLPHYAYLNLQANNNIKDISTTHKTISIDKPFIYTIVEERTNTILLMGLYAQPN